jgi:hypothetical protein
LHELACLLACETVTGNNRRWVYFRFHQLVRPTEKLSGYDDDRGRAVANLLVLLLREVDKDPSRRILYGEKGENRGTVIGDSDFLNSYIV